MGSPSDSCSLCLYVQSEAFLTDHQNAAQRMLDGMNFVIQSVSEYSTGPTKAVTSWLTDQVAPLYWRPNTDITVSHHSHSIVEPATRHLDQQHTHRLFEQIAEP